MKRLILTAALCLVVSAASQSRQAGRKPPSRAFAIDAAESQIAAILTQEGLISRRYPSHRVVAKSFNGRIELPKDETRLKVEIEADPKTMTNVDEAMGEFERKEFHNVLRNEVLESAKFPSIKFVSASVADVKRSGGARSFTLHGDLSLHGVTKRVSFPVNVTISSDQLRATGEAKLKQSDFGMKPFEKGLGLIKIGDELKVGFTIVAKPQ